MPPPREQHSNHQPYLTAPEDICSLSAVAWCPSDGESPSSSPGACGCCSLPAVCVPSLFSRPLCAKQSVPSKLAPSPCSRHDDSDTSSSPTSSTRPFLPLSQPRFPALVANEKPQLSFRSSKENSSKQEDVKIHISQRIQQCSPGSGNYLWLHMQLLDSRT